MASRRFLLTDELLHEIDRDSVIDDDFVESLEPLESTSPAVQSNTNRPSDGPVLNTLGYPQVSSTPVEERANRRSDLLARSTPRPLFPVSPINPAANNTSSVSQSSHDVPAVTLADLYQQNKRLAEELKEVKSRLAKGKSQLQRSKRVVVPSAYSQAVRETYGKIFRPGDQNGGFNLFLMKSCPENEAVIERLTREVQTLYGRSRWEVLQIKKACKTYYNSLRDKSRRQRNGTYSKHTDAARKRGRQFRKLQRRRSAMQSIALSESAKAEANEVLRMEFMSSEESMSEDEDEGTSQAQTRRLRKLPWERSKLTSLKHKLDSHFAATAPAIVSRLLPKFIAGGISTRPAPEGAPSWAVRS